MARNPVKGIARDLCSKKKVYSFREEQDKVSPATAKIVATDKFRNKSNDLFTGLLRGFRYQNRFSLRNFLKASAVMTSPLIKASKIAGYFHLTLINRLQQTTDKATLFHNFLKVCGHALYAFPAAKNIWLPLPGSDNYFGSILAVFFYGMKN
ncbi:hypothetical protein EPN96_08235 [bacterium]|nr:MAG: hypothetical protein EPN96_08235 [bacterium]